MRISDWSSDVCSSDLLDFSASGAAATTTKEQPAMSLQILDALQVVSYRIAAIGLEPEFVRSYPAIERYESPFLMQNVEVHAFIADRCSAATEKRDTAIDDQHQIGRASCRERVGPDG